MNPSLKIRAAALAAAFVAGTASIAVGSTSASATTVFEVTKQADTADGSCSAGDCSLREAIIAANANAGADTINVPAGTYTLTRTGSDDTASLGDLDIADGVSMLGAGAGATIIDGNNTDRVFHILSSSANTTLVDMTIQHGRVVDQGGGGVWNLGTATSIWHVVVRANHDDGADDSAAIGGGIRNNGTMQMTQSTVSGNSATRGGGIFDAGGASILIYSSTFSGNTSPGVSAAQMYGTNTISDSTFSGNVSSGGGPALLQESAATLALSDVTIADNTGYGLEPGYPGTSLRNTIVAGNSAGDCLGSVNTSYGGNIASDASCSLPHGTDLDSTDPMIGPLKDNGGGTLTHALKPGSPGIDTGNITCSAADQRGAPRSGQCDRGAYEFVTCGGLPATMIGTANADVLKGSRRPDVALAYGGGDTINGKGGNDRLCGGDGDDKLIGGDGNDRLYGEVGTDVCIGGLGRDTAATCETEKSIP